MSALPKANGLIPSVELSIFVNKQGRLPRLGDVSAPWHYRGWLLAYVILLHAQCPAVADRWGYYLRTREAGKLLEEPIPQIELGTPNNQVFSLLHNWSRLIGWDCGGWTDFRTLLDWICWGLALSQEEPRLTKEVQEKLYRTVNLGPLLEKPYDYLGEHVSRSKAKGWNPTGFYPTPHPVVECMVRMAMHDTPKDHRDPRTYSVCDPCVGSGRMLLHASNISLNLHGQDIDPLAVAMCKVNGALYAPWLAFPLPEAILSKSVESHSTSSPEAETASEILRIFRVDKHGQGLLFES